MVDLGEYGWDPSVPANNGSADPLFSMLGSQLVSSLDDNLRKWMQRHRQWLQEQGGTMTVGGTGDAVTLTTLSTYEGYSADMRFTYIPTAANTGAATVQIDGIATPKKIRKISGGTDVALAAADMVIGVPAFLLYRTAADTGTGAFILLNPATGAGIGAYPTGHLFGTTISNNATDATNDLDVAAGSARSDDDTANIVLAASITKRLDANWAVGTNQGGLDTGSAADGTVHVFLIKRPDTGVVDVLFSISVTSPTMPTNYTLKRRIGSVRRESAALVAFVQDGDLFERKVPVLDISAASQTTTASLRTLSTPSNLKVQAIISVSISTTTTNSSFGLLVTDPDQTDTVPGTPGGAPNDLALVSLTTAGTYYASSARFLCRTDTSKQIRTRAGNGTVTLGISTHGWVDTRGRLA